MKFSKAERIIENITDHVQYGTLTLHYTLHYARRRTLAIHVETNGDVVVEAPEGVPLRKIRETVKAKGPWIQSQKREVTRLASPLPDREYVSGESYRYLGRQYRLKVMEADHNAVKLTRGILYLLVKNRENAALREQLMKDWYLQRAKKIFAERVQAVTPVANRAGIPEPSRLSVRRMTTRWGSCSKSGHVVLNTELVRAPKDCIDYVILHELCHLAIPRHNTDFYQLLTRVCPDWKSLRSKLNAIVELKL
ncbi:M48 family metallopeptidase [Deinococcus roseus]|uniref:Metal-dependent hydrolase n=1 Tax=Deinococcus roseus TaxID=392414 RepID=A0ABQ2D0C3_9DEIO|nr:SprT family zinc-dependent metalloprotease [Deinococcus roseus]GGJ27306.1 metal-dependent hydrolase [Deinococcus roseus]